MNFCDVLNNYMNTLKITLRELSLSSGVSQSIICRYRKGDVIPKKDSEQIHKIIDGLYTLSVKKHISLTKSKIRNDLYLHLNDIRKEDYDTFRNNLNILIHTLNINVADLAKNTGYSPSLISKVRNGKKNPGSIYQFAKLVCKYTVSNYNAANYKDLISKLIQRNSNDINDDEDYVEKLYFWILNNKKYRVNDYINDVLSRVDNFNLSEYSTDYNFDLELPVDFYSSQKEKFFYGIKGMKEAQIIALKEIALSDNQDPIYIIADAPLDEFDKDKDYLNNFLAIMNLIVKKNVDIYVVHKIDRPLKELLFGFTIWLPFYISGNVHPYYFKNYQNNIYYHYDYISSNIVLSGEAVTNHHNDGKYYLTDSKKNIEYYKNKAKHLLSNATPLAEILTSKDKDSFTELITNNTDIRGTRKNRLSKFPTYTLSKDLLNKILTNNNIDEKDQKIITDFVELEKERILKILEKDLVYDEINIMSEEEFNSNRHTMSLFKLFYDKEIFYTYEEYIKHFTLTREFESKHENYHLKLIENSPFKNIAIYTIIGKQVIVSKEKNPTVHLVSYSNKIVNAIEKL